MKKHLFFLLFLFTTVIAAAGDYVADINSSTTKRDEGRRVVYEMNVGSFTAEGTFAAASARLEELRAFGIDVVWLMPIYPRGSSGSPYAATNFKQTNPAYGTIADLGTLVTKAHSLGMEVWLDWVPNHTATNADWVTSHPEYYAQSGGQMIHPNNYNDVWQLDYTNSGLVNAMNDCLKFWIDQADIDGYRCDYISSSRIPASYWQATIPLIKNYKTGKKITFLGEADIATDATRLKNVGFDYDYAWQFQSNLASYGGSNTQAAQLKTIGTRLLNASAELTFGRMLYVTNHDQNFNDGGKTLSQMYGDNRYPLTVFAATLYGMPLIYNGQETGGNQILNYFSDTKINWNTRDDKMFNTLRTLCALKHEIEAVSDAKQASSNPAVTWNTVSGSSSIQAYTRKLGDSELLVILNMGTASATASISGINAGAWSLWLNSETVARGVSRHQEQLNSSHTFTLEAKGYRVYVRGTYSEETIPEIEINYYTPVLENENEVSVFLETSTEGNYFVWVWGSLGGGEAYTTSGAWPGDGMTLMGKGTNGNLIYKYVQTKTSGIPEYLIITQFDNGAETRRLWDGTPFVNHGYYIDGTTYSDAVKPAVITATDGIEDIPFLRNNDNSLIFDLNGRLVTQPMSPGIYIRDGQKFIVR
ncbi:MAG: hypothetical protein J6X81_06100 [Muribaculaceae bacterium]|nr:hypothetical protein [Muribaculaceae bacterium]